MYGKSVPEIISQFNQQVENLTKDLLFTINDGCGGKITLNKKENTMKDNWKHRSIGMRCGSCMWFVAKAKSENEPVEDSKAGSIGRCRRHAPTMSGFPVVYETDWCGDHKIDETK